MNNFFKKTLPSMFATVASGVPGPIGVVASLIGKVVNKDVQPNSEAISEAISGATPDQLLELKKVDNEHGEKMAQLGFQDNEALAKIMADDRDSARKMQIAVKDWMPAVLGLLATFGFLATIAALIFIKFDPMSKDVLLVLLGILGKMVSDVYGFYFGSSAGQEALTKLTGKG